MGMTSELTAERTGCFRSHARSAFRSIGLCRPSGARHKTEMAGRIAFKENRPSQERAHE